MGGGGVARGGSRGRGVKGGGGGRWGCVWEGLTLIFNIYRA
jgi:hypothetical protein